MSVMELRFALVVITIALVSETLMCRLPPRYNIIHQDFFEENL